MLSTLTSSGCDRRLVVTDDVRISLPSAVTRVNNNSAIGGCTVPRISKSTGTACGVLHGALMMGGSTYPIEASRGCNEISSFHVGG